MDVFQLREGVVRDYASYVQSFLNIRDPAIRALVDERLRQGLLWPDALLQLNPAFEAGESQLDLVREGSLHEECPRIFVT